MAQLGKTKSVAVAFIGKVKTVAQMTAIIALLLYEPLIPGVSTPLLGTVALWVAAILTLWSMFHYLRLAAPHRDAFDPSHAVIAATLSALTQASREKL